MDSKRFLIISLACYRLAQLIAYDDGPLWVFDKLRRWTDKKSKEDLERKLSRPLLGPVASKSELEEETRQIEKVRGKWQSIADGIHCPFCVGMWLVLPLYLISKKWYTPVYLIAIAGAQSWLEGIKK